MNHPQGHRIPVALDIFLPLFVCVWIHIQHKSGEHLIASPFLTSIHEQWDSN